MKFIFGVLIAGLVICVVQSFPASDNTNDDAEYVFVPLKQNREIPDWQDGNFQGVIDTGNTYFPQPSYYPWSFNFRGFFDNLQDIIFRMTQNVASRWSPEIDSNAKWTPTDDGKGNTTSNVKIIDGQKVTINDTVYTKESDYGKSVFKIRVVDVKRVDDDTNNVSNIPTTDDDKTIVLNTKIGETDDSTEIIDKSTEAGNTSDKKETVGSPEELDNTDNEIQTADIDGSDNKVEKCIEEHTEHQNYMHKSTFTQNYPENEFIESYPNKNQQPTWESAEESEIDHENDLLFDEQLPEFNLSNDIAVNDILAANGAPTNPDAEYFNIEEIPIEPVASSASSLSYHLPKYESMRFEVIKK